MISLDLRDFVKNIPKLKDVKSFKTALAVKIIKIGGF
jgi:hypothetical protein